MKLILLLVLLSALAAAEVGTGPGPYRRMDVFEAANQNPNATGTGLLVAVNMSVPPSQVFLSTWNASINLTEVPGPTTDHADDVQANTVIALDSMDGFAGNNRGLWNSCVVLMQSLTREAIVDGNSADERGDCRATLGEKCTDDWLDLLRSAKADAGRDVRMSNTTSPCNGMSMPNIPPSCEGRLGIANLRFDVTANTTSGNALFYDTSAYYNPSNSSASDIYNAAATRIWPLVLLQGATYAFNDGGGFTAANIVCLKANVTRKGSREVDNVPGTGASVGNNMLVVLGVASLMAFLMS